MKNWIKALVVIPFLTAPSIKISATVGYPSLSIYGYGPVNAMVFLNGFGVQDTTVADSNGMFYFDNVYTYNFSYPELCLYAQDEEKLVTQPSCIPALPVESYKIEVGPIILSPTISVSPDNTASGRFLPNSVINVHLAKTGITPSISLVKNTYAYFLPDYEVRADGSGYYEFNFSDVDEGEYKIFTTSTWQEFPSGKSNTLNLSIKNYFYYLIEWILLMFTFNKLAWIIAIEIILIIILLIPLLKSPKMSHKVKSKKALDIQRRYIEQLKKKIKI